MPTGNNPPSATILHVSDTQFGNYHRFGTEDSLSRSLIRDLDRLTSVEKVPKPDLMILSGDITERADEDEFAEALAFIDEIRAVTGLARERVVVVPGNHDVSWPWSESYFFDCRARKKEPSVPYSLKWRNYQDFVARLHGPTAFTEERPYRLHLFEDLRVAVAAMNSTIMESHRDDDHYGWCGDEQYRWFARELGGLEGMLRIAVLHHNARRKADADNENLRDEESLGAILHGRIDLVLHGHTHEGKEDRLPDGTLVLATGSAAVTADWRPGETPNQYQIFRVGPRTVTRWARQWDGQREWIPDLRADPERRSTKVTIRHGVPGWRKPRPEPEKDARHEIRQGYGGRTADFVAQVELTTRRDLGEGALVQVRTIGDPPLHYLMASTAGRPLRYIGIVDGPVDAAILGEFDRRVFDPVRHHQPERIVVHCGPDDPTLRDEARKNGILVKTWTEYTDLLDASAYREWLRQALAGDKLYRQELYQAQRYRDIDRWGGAQPDVHGDLRATVYQELLHEDGRFILILGDAGYGKSFLVRRLAHEMLANDRLGITPIVIYLRDRDKRQTLEEMVSAVLIPSGSTFRLRHFRHSLEAGTLALLIDGYDEFAVRVGYDNAAAQLHTFLNAMEGRAKILLTTRPSHFRSTDQVTSKLFADLQTVHNRRVHLLEPFDTEQQRAFLARYFELGGKANPAALAHEWMTALAAVDNLPELARTPRMLSFIVEDLDLREIKAAAGQEVVTAADLYDRLVGRWLGEEAVRLDPMSESNVSHEKRREVLEEIALRIWRAGEQDVNETALQDAARKVIDLPAHKLTVDQAAQITGSRTLLRVDGQRWKFAHQSVWEYLLAVRIAASLRAGEEVLGDAQLTGLTARFLRDIAPEHVTAWLSRLSTRNVSKRNVEKGIDERLA
ncbi:metallophosphoesterase [Sphaerisporangium sp. B11E5]|uniref:metallophosphoesterase n=1 Tax=Sphaerisporangium sp. B11E5 TaxID=3153563 RepID=UPI00325CFBDA